jgi:hypothetical protein
VQNKRLGSSWVGSVAHGEEPGPAESSVEYIRNVSVYIFVPELESTYIECIIPERLRCTGPSVGHDEVGGSGGGSGYVSNGEEKQKIHRVQYM